MSKNRLLQITIVDIWRSPLEWVNFEHHLSEFSLTILNWASMNDKRKAEMKAWMREVKKERKELTQFSNKAESFAYPSVKTRIENPGLSTRSYFVKKLADYIGNDTFSKKDIVRLAFIAEMTTNVTYLENQLVDNKYGITTSAKKTDNHISAQILKGVIKDYIFTCFQEKGEGISNQVEKIYYHFSWGEYMEVKLTNFESFGANSEGIHALCSEIDQRVKVEEFMNTFLKWPEHTLISQHHFLRIYFTRTYLINTSLYETITKILIRLAGKSEKDYSRLIVFARRFGLVQQLVNDISDFVPSWCLNEKVQPGNKYKFRTPTKYIDDAFADLRNRLLTLPILFWLNSNPRENEMLLSYLENPGDKTDFTSDILQKYVSELFKESKAFVHSIDLVKHMAQDSISLLDPKNDATFELVDMMGIAKSNTYYDLIRDKILFGVT